MELHTTLEGLSNTSGVCVVEPGFTTATCCHVLVDALRTASTALTSMLRGWTVRFSQSMSGRCRVSHGIPKIQSNDPLKSITWNLSLLVKASNRYGNTTDRCRCVRGTPSANFTIISPGDSRTRSRDGRIERLSARTKFFVAPESNKSRSGRDAPST